jgi:diguanylate cyclase (GGDEF)-like protein
MNQNHLATRHNSLLELSRKIAEALLLIDNKSINDLAGRTSGLLNRSHTPQNLDDMRREWGRFAIEYKGERSRQRLSQFVNVEQDDDIDTLIDKVIPLLEREKSMRGGHGVIDLLMQSAKPSLSNEKSAELDKIYKTLRANPDKIYDPETQEKISNLYDKRVEADRGEEKRTLQQAKKLVGSLVDEVDSPKAQTEQKEIEVKEKIEILKNGVNAIEQNSDDSKEILTSLEDGIESIGKQTSGLFSSLKKYSTGLFDVKDKIDKFENELNSRRREADRDMLTGMRNRKGFEYDLSEVEKEFQEHGNNYSVIVIDIDGFRTIAEKYGNDAGDLIIRYFSKILKEYISVGDSTARYGEDRFVVSLPNRNLGDALQFVKKFKEKVKHTKFVYKDERVIVTFSAGISDREGVEDVTKIIDNSYKMLKEAKARGKNGFYPEE